MDVHEPVSYLSWSPDDTKLLGCGASTEVKMWNVENGRMVKELGGHGGCVAACSFSTGIVFFLIYLLCRYLINSKKKKKKKNRWETGDYWRVR